MNIFLIKLSSRSQDDGNVKVTRVCKTFIEFVAEGKTIKYPIPVFALKNIVTDSYSFIGKQ